jgi:hypothetical protein
VDFSAFNDSAFVQGTEGLYVKPRVSEKNVLLRDAKGLVVFAVFGIAGALPHPLHVGPMYCSARNGYDARKVFHRRYKHLSFSTVYAAPAVGWFVHDTHGEKLSASGVQKSLLEKTG